MTRILHFFKTYVPDSFAGIERSIWALAEGAESRGFDVDVLSLSDDPVQGSRPVDHHFAYKAKLDLYVASTGFSASAFARFRALAKDADIIHYHFPWPFMDLVHLVTNAGKPSVVTYHSDIVKQKALMWLYTPLMHAFLDRVDVIVATSPNYTRSSPVLRRYARKTTTVPLGLNDSGMLTPDSDLVERWRSRVGSDFFLFCGALRYYKGLQVLIKAARRNGLPVVVAGNGDMAPLLAESGLSNLHHIASFTDEDKSALLHLSRAFVFPSHLRSEAYGLALVEAAMAGRAMISCELGTGTSFVNRHGQTGLVVPPNDAPALDAAMQDLWQHPEKAKALGAAARRHYEQNLRADTMVQSYVDLYDNLVPRREPLA